MRALPEGAVVAVLVNDRSVRTRTRARLASTRTAVDGIGTALNQLAIDAAREAGCKQVWLSVEPSNRAAVRSCEKAGFRRLPGSLWAPEIEMMAELAPAS